MDYEQRRVMVAGRPVKLMGTEYDLLRVLSVNGGPVTTFDSLLRQVWGTPSMTRRPWGLSRMPFILQLSRRIPTKIDR